MDGQTVQAEGPGTIIDKGSGDAAYDGQNVVLGQASISWAGALRFVIGSYAFAGGYDANGNLTSRVVDGAAYLFTYDEENHLTGVSGAKTATFVYDGDGARVKGTVNGTTVAYIGSHFEWAGSTSTMKKYYYAGGTRVAMRVGSTSLYYLLTDHLGSTAITANSSGGLSSEKRYMPWGEERYTNGTLPTTFRFTGQREEVDLGLYFYQSRWYDAALGRFLQADTIVPDPYNAQAFDRYAYALNNPVRYVDPSGHRTCTDQQAATGDETCDQNYPENEIDYVIHKILMGTFELGPSGLELDPGDHQLPLPTSIGDLIVRAITLIGYYLKPFSDDMADRNVFVWLTYHEYEESISLYGISVNNYSDQTVYLSYVDISASTHSLPPEIINEYTILPGSRGYKSDYLATILPSSSQETLLILGSPYACQYPTFSPSVNVEVNAWFKLLTDLAGVIAVPVEVTIPVP